MSTLRPPRRPDRRNGRQAPRGRHGSWRTVRPPATRPPPGSGAPSGGVASPDQRLRAFGARLRRRSGGHPFGFLGEQRARPSPRACPPRVGRPPPVRRLRPPAARCPRRRRGPRRWRRWSDGRPGPSPSVARDRRGVARSGRGAPSGVGQDRPAPGSVGPAPRRPSPGTVHGPGRATPRPRRGPHRAPPRSGWLVRSRSSAAAASLFSVCSASRDSVSARLCSTCS